MKILLINFSDVGGGAAMAAIRLVTTLNEKGIYARLGVPEKKSSNPYVFELPQKQSSYIYKKFRRSALHLPKVNCFIFFIK